MLENFSLLAIILILLWAGGIAFYFYTSRGQKDLSNKIDALQEKLGKVEREEQ